MDVPPHHTLCTLLVQLPTLSTIVPFSRNFSTQNSLPNFGILTSVDRNSSLVPISKKVQHLDLTRLPSPPPVPSQRPTPNAKSSRYAARSISSNYPDIEIGKIPFDWISCFPNFRLPLARTFPYFDIAIYTKTLSCFIGRLPLTQKYRQDALHPQRGDPGDS